jgi:hypothetical protein
LFCPYRRCVVFRPIYITHVNYSYFTHVICCSLYPCNVTITQDCMGNLIVCNFAPERLDLAFHRSKHPRLDLARKHPKTDSKPKINGGKPDSKTLKPSHNKTFTKMTLLRSQ